MKNIGRAKSANEGPTEFGNLISHPPPGEEVVISGMSGTFPLADNIDEYKHNLYNKIYMVSQVPKLYPEMPEGFGLMKNRSRFDRGFFDLLERQAKVLNPMCKALLEKCYECICDAGLHPSDLEGTKTGVFLALSTSELEAQYFVCEHIKGANTMLGNIKSAMANKISHHFKLSGPSYNTDTGCSSGGYALEQALKAIRMGQCDSALIAGASLIVINGWCVQYARLGVLAPDAISRPFDADGFGYVRSDSVSAVLLQRAKNSKRIYAKIVHVKTNCDGFKEQGITHPSRITQTVLLNEVYSECGVNPLDVSYVEAHATGTIAGDTEETNSIDTFFTPGRSEPLLVGSVKSNMGHGEPCALLCSLVKIILAFETNTIAPNMNYTKPKETIPGLLEGRLKVVTENTLLPASNLLIGINSFGIGGANAHVLLKRCSKVKHENGEPNDVLPRLVCVSGRTQEAVEVLLDDVALNFNEEHIALIHNMFRKAIKGHMYRGYAVTSKQGFLAKSITPFKGIKSLHVHFGFVALSTENFSLEFLQHSLLFALNNQLKKFFEEKKINFWSVLQNQESSVAQLLFSCITHLTYAELLKLLNVKPNVFSASSIGHLTKAYCEKNISLNKYLDCMYGMIECLESSKKIEGSSNDLVGKLVKHRKQLIFAFESCFSYNNMVNGFCNGEVNKYARNLVNEICSNWESAEIPTIKHRSIVLEIGTRKTFAKRKSNVLTVTPHTGIPDFLRILGKLYECGQEPQIQRFYPKVQFPVSRGTPMISPKIKWRHEAIYPNPTFEGTLRVNEVREFTICLEDDPWTILKGHVVDGRKLVSVTTYLYLTWRVFSEMHATTVNRQKIVFENCRFVRACQVASTRESIKLSVMIQRSSGNFEITDNDGLIATGRVSERHEKMAKFADKSLENVDGRLMNIKDIYKELRLRGYSYEGVFKGLMQCNTTATHGKIRWNSSWVSFMDNMLQLRILKEDTRLLYVPVRIGKVVIDPEFHLRVVNQAAEKEIHDISAFIDYDSGFIWSGGIQFSGILATSVAKRKCLDIPILEKDIFLPNKAVLPLESAVRVFMQLALEHNSGFKITVLELADEEENENWLPDDGKYGPMGAIIKDVLDDQPYVQVNINTLYKNAIAGDIASVQKDLKDFKDVTIVIANNVLNDELVLKKVLKVTKDNGFIISSEAISAEIPEKPPHNLEILSVIHTDTEKLLFLQKRKFVKKSKPQVFINVTSQFKDFKWLNRLKEEIKKDQDVIIWSQNEPLCGLIGLLKCIRREPNKQNLRGMFIVDNAPSFDPNLPFYKKQLQKHMTLNIFMNGTWGTYRHLLLDSPQEIETQHCYVNIVRGDLSTLKWIEGPLSIKNQEQDNIVEVYFASLNVKDVLTASRKFYTNTTQGRLTQECMQGIEFSGKTVSGKTVMGMVPQGALATLVKSDPNLLWEVPETWSLEEAATVPVAYATCLYALIVVGKIKPIESVFIHSVNGDIEQAALTLCHWMGCKIFAVAETEEKRNFIRRNFPQIKEGHIVTLGDLSFEETILRETNGKGVDVILSSISEEKLINPTRCLPRKGRFIEIGKFDTASDNALGLLPLRGGSSYHGVMLDKLLVENDSVKRNLNRLLKKYLDLGAIKPLNTSVFGKDEVEEALRFMATEGEKMGKVVVSIRNEDAQIQENHFRGLPRYFCDPSKTYVICGGLGGFGLELVDWLIHRGAKNIVISSRKGITTGYQNLRYSIWKKYGCNIIISTADMTTLEGCQILINEANALAPVGAIFNLAVVLKDCLLENQTEESFYLSFGPKAYATKYLDEVSRQHCPKLRDFVMFSSASCGIGHPGQANYGMSNSVMERICEQRRRDGYPALAIQWGAIRDVGLAADLQENNGLEIIGVIQQSIASGLQVLDQFLTQNEATVVSSMLVAEKRSCGDSSGDILDVVGGLLGIRDVKSVSIQSTLAEIGMDSMNAAEIKQTLEREFNVILSTEEMRTLTLARLKELQDVRVNTESGKDVESHSLDWSDVLKHLFNNEKQTFCITKLRTKPSHHDETTLPKIIVFPGFEGVCSLLENLTQLLEVQAYGINYTSCIQEDSISKMAETILPGLLTLLGPNEPFNLVAHSFGTILALEIASRLEQLNYRGTLTLLDGSPTLVKELCHGISAENPENFLIAHILKIRLSKEETEGLMIDVEKCSTFDDKLLLLAKTCIKAENGGNTVDFLRGAITGLLNRIDLALSYQPQLDKLKSQAFLAKPNLTTVEIDAEDYDLGTFFEPKLDIKVFEGRHNTFFLQNEELAETVKENLTHKLCS